MLKNTLISFVFCTISLISVADEVRLNKEAPTLLRKAIRFGIYQ